MSAVQVAAPTIEHHTFPFGIGTATPRLSWITGAPAGWKQAAAQLRLTVDGEHTDAELAGSDSVLVTWPFPPLPSRTRATVAVRVTDDGGSYSPWSPSTVVETGLLRPEDWSATPIGPGWDEQPGTMRRPALLRTEFEIPEAPISARLYATAHGVYQPEINGQRTGDDELAPGWTSYRHRLRYQSYDVTDLIQPGRNAMGVWLADGWFRGRLGFHGGHTDIYGTQTALLAQLELTFADGSTRTIRTGPDWRAAPSPILASGLLEGEAYDARAEQPGWSATPFDASGWVSGAERHIDLSTLVAPTGPPVRVTEEIAPVAFDTRPDGRVIVDFGQNLVGRLRITSTGDRGSVVRLRHAEILESDGELCVRPLRGATSVDEYTRRGGDAETWEPRFTIHGFRYAEITGIPENELRTGAVIARVLHTDMRRTGWFESSDPELNRLHENVVWSMRGNFVDLPTDCPQRDERLGWTGDIQVFAPTASFLFDTAGLLTSWLQDLAAEQHPDGTVPWFVPEIPGGDQWTPARPGAGWGDAAVLIPDTLHALFGDTGVLADQWASARAWADLQNRLAGDRHVWDQSYQLGDWLDPTAPPDAPEKGLTDPNLVATAYYARSADVTARIADTLGHADAAHLHERAVAAREGFRSAYLAGPGTLTSQSQAAYAIGICFDLFDANELDIAGAHLARLVRDAGIHLTTGFLGTPVLLDALTRTGNQPLAFELLKQRTAPSWLYPVTMGATTIWERWDSMLPDGTINPGDMTSFNHYAFGAVADWMHRHLAGLTATAPGWRTLRFQPYIHGGLRFARAAHDTPYGRASISWQLDGDQADIELVVPTGTSAELVHPDGKNEPLTSGTHHRRVPAAAAAPRPASE